MPFARAHRRFTAWLAMLAMVLGALAPTVAQAVVASSDHDGWVQVCSVSGMVWVQADADPASGDAPMASGAMDCPWCSLHGGVPGLPPVSAGAEPLAPQAEPLPIYLRTAALRGTWASGLARAPPLSA
ncbi:lipoprotein [Hydrogenophaga taeniospiralis CCUG 15921]|uniref:Lipoprotein n=1 Tax=Hydrogenophaga taeniospiralis CCUG 15921 TaxID=1281780 RepID=A0A9X4NWH5_9BURK|nr:DUF2946 domain-containing protein [Hydrogenophaga taeniospiralis]MDG5977559.1 lipoprotein [Hydrogenophaga taeniospiralis CCUG 15921]